MLVPARWHGSVEHFYHFFFGYFMPVVLWLHKNPAPSIALRDCGLMNPWFDLISPKTKIEIIPTGVMLQRALTNRQTNQILGGWDDLTHFHKSAINQLRQIVGGSLGLIRTPKHSATRSVTILERRIAPVFFENDAEVLGSGVASRSIPNLPKITAPLIDDLEVRFLDTAEIPPQQQVEMLWDSEILVAQYGAGLSKMVWMKPGSLVIEIQPSLPPTVDSIFTNLAATCQFKATIIWQDHEHAEIDLKVSAEIINAQPGDSTQFQVPKQPGSLPFRLLRGLPRSW